MVKSNIDKINEHFKKYKDINIKKKRPRVVLSGKKVNLMGIAKGKVYKLNNINYPIFSKTGLLSAAKNSKDRKLYEAALAQDPSKESYIKIATSIDKSLTPEVAELLYDFANNKSNQIIPDTVDIKPGKTKTKAPINNKQTKDEKSADKSKDDNDIIFIDGKNLYTHLLKKGEAGVYWNGLIYPVFKDTKTNTFKNSWSMVREQRTEEELALFKRMSQMSPEAAESEYFKFMENRGIPTNVIAKALQVTQEMNSKLKNIIDNNIEKNINNEDQFDTGFNLADLKLNEKGGVDRLVKKYSLRGPTIKAEEELTVKTEPIKRSLEEEPEAEPQTEGEPQAEPEADSSEATPAPPNTPEITPQQAPVDPPSININQEQEEQERENIERDFIPDISKFGHTLAVQNIFTRFNKDFTYFKSLVKNTDLNPSQDKNTRKKQIDQIIAEYSSLFPIEKVTSDYSYEECLEIVTLKYTYIQNIRFEMSWKRSLINFNLPNNNNIQNMQRAFIVQQPMGTLGSMGSATPKEPEAPKEPIRTKSSARSGKIPSVNHEIIAKPQMIKPRNIRKRNKIFNDKPMILNIRKKTINDKLLYTNLRHQPSQQNMQQPGLLPIMRIKDRKRSKRLKL